MSQLATRSSCAYLLRATATRRWISSEAQELPAESVAAISTRKEEAAAGNRAIMKFLGKAKTEGNLIEALNKAVMDGVAIKKWHITMSINQYRSGYMYKPALQLSEWMDINTFPASDADRAVRIELLSKAKDLASAEVYFNSLQESEKTTKTYGALLNCYCHRKHLKKACSLFEKIKEVRVLSTLNYNSMISLYLKTGPPEKILALVKEMEDTKIDMNLYTYNLLMKSYAALKDIDAVEGVLEKMKASNIEIDSFTCRNLATIYVNAGLLEKASSVLEKMAEMENDLEAFHTLITLNAQVSNVTGVYQAWKSLKMAIPKLGNTSYLVMLMALSKLGDVERLEKYFREWESKHTRYDVRLSNVLLESYLKRDMIEEAELLHNSVLERGVQPNLRMFELFIIFYTKNSQFDLAIKYLEVGASRAAKMKKKWVLPNETVKSFLKYFEENRDADTAQMFCESMKRVRCPDTTLYDSVLSFNIISQKEPQP